MPEQRDPDEIVPVHFVAYDDEADLSIDNSGDGASIEDHDELVNSGQTYDEIRGLRRESAEKHDLDIVRPGDPLWDDRLEHIEEDGPFRLEELRD